MVKVDHRYGKKIIKAAYNMHRRWGSRVRLEYPIEEMIMDAWRIVEVYEKKHGLMDETHAVAFATRHLKFRCWHIAKQLTRIKYGGNNDGIIPNMLSFDYESEGMMSLKDRVSDTVRISSVSRWEIIWLGVLVFRSITKTKRKVVADVMRNDGAMMGYDEVKDHDGTIKAKGMTRQRVQQIMVDVMKVAQSIAIKRGMKDNPSGSQVV